MNSKIITRSDVKTAINLEWDQDYSDEWSAFVGSEQITICENNVYGIYFGEYEIGTATTLEKAKMIAKAWVVNFICNALNIK